MFFGMFTQRYYGLHVDGEATYGCFWLVKRLGFGLMNHKSQGVLLFMEVGVGLVYKYLMEFISTQWKLVYESH